MKEDIRKKLIEVEEDIKKRYENNLEKHIISYNKNQSISSYVDIENTIEHIRKCESKIIGYSLDNLFTHPTKLQIAMSECKPGKLYDLYYSKSKEVEKNDITDEEIINKADAYIDKRFDYFGSNKKLREFGNNISIKLTEVYIEAYKQALKDNNLLK